MYNIFEKDFLVLPLSPQVCIAIYKDDKETIKKYNEDSDVKIVLCKHYNIYETSIVMKMNDYALYTEISTANRFVVGNEEELKRLLKILK